MENVTPETVETRPARRAYQKYIRKFPRSIAARQLSEHETLSYRAVYWLLPWGLIDYPGIRRGIVELTGIPWGTIKDYRNGRRHLTARVARIFIDIIRSRCEAGQAIIAELEAIEASYVNGRSKPSGWRIVRDRDGVVRDGRGSFKRKE